MSARSSRLPRLLRHTLACAILASTARLLLSQDPGSTSPKGLSGIWDLRIISGDSAALSPSQLRSATHRGEIALLRTPASVGKNWLSLSEPTHFGVFTLQTEVFDLPAGIRVALGERLWTAGARLVGDSAVVVLRPDLSHGAIVLSGRLAADSITGDLVVTGYGTHRVGSFVLWRDKSRQ